MSSQLNKPPKSMETRIKASKMLPCFKRFFLFMINQGVQFSKDDVKRWNKDVMTQKHKDDRSRNSATTCSFVATGSKVLPRLQGVPEKALSSLNTALKKYGEVLWFKIVKEKVFINFNIFTVKQVATLLKDIESRKLEKEILRALGLDLFRAHPRTKNNVTLITTFCHSDMEEIRKIVAETHQDSDVKADTDRQLVENPIHSGKPAPFDRNQPVEVYSKTSGQWVRAEVICVQEDNEGIFVTVCRNDGHELDYDIDCVRAIQIVNQSQPMPREDTIARAAVRSGERREPVHHEGHFEFSEQTGFREQDLAPAHMPEAYQPQPQHQPSACIISDAEWFRRMENFHIFDKIRSVKNYLHRMRQESDALPQMIVEELQEVVEMLPKLKNIQLRSVVEE